MEYKTLRSLLFFFFTAIQCIPWTPSTLLAQRPFRQLRTYAHMQALIHTDTTIQARRSAIERWIRARSRFGVRFDQVPVVQVVFHVLWSSEEERLDEARLLQQMQALERDFDTDPQLGNRTDWFTNVRFVNPAIRFRRAEHDPSGQVTNGIEYIHTTREIWHETEWIKNPLSGGAEAWDPEEYLNIWIGHLPDSVSGYAQMPGGPDSTDGIVIDYRYIGPSDMADSPYHQGKTLTHLIANYLNVFSLWNPDCLDDYVSDTPVHQLPNYGCPGMRKQSPCDPSRPEMVFNFMDNTDDACMVAFTMGQAIRMRLALEPGGSREGLVCFLKSQDKTSP